MLAWNYNMTNKGMRCSLFLSAYVFMTTLDFKLFVDKIGDCRSVCFSK